MEPVIPTPALAYCLLGFTVVALWLQPWSWLWPWLWVMAMLAFIAVCLWLELLSPVALVPLFTLAVLYFTYRRYVSQTWMRVGLLALVSLLSVGLGLHAFPGFSFWQVIDSVRLSDMSASFSLRYYLDKPIIGVLVLGLAYTGLCRSWPQWRELFSRAWLPMLATVAAVYLLSLLLGYTRWDPKYSSVFWLWAAKNLLFVCVAEEAFFRGFLQRELAELIPHRQSKVIALIVVAGLFGVAHIAGGVNYMLLATVAGLGYGYVFYRTDRIEAAILTHFILNAGHFLLFTYPYRQPIVAS